MLVANGWGYQEKQKQCLSFKEIQITFRRVAMNKAFPQKKRNLFTYGLITSNWRPKRVRKNEMNHICYHAIYIWKGASKNSFQTK